MEPRAYTSTADLVVPVCFAAVIALIGLGGVVTYAHRPAIAVAIGLGFGAYVAVLVRGAIRMGIFTDERGLKLNWILRTRYLAWEEIEMFGYAENEAGIRGAVVAHLRDGDLVRLPIPGRSRAAEALNDQLDEVRRLRA